MKGKYVPSLDWNKQREDIKYENYTVQWWHPWFGLIKLLKKLEVIK